MESISEVVPTLIEWLTKNIIKLIIGIAVISIGFNIIDKLVKRFIIFLQKRRIDETIRKFSKPFVSISAKIILVMFVAEYWGIRLTGFAALLTSAGVAIGLALQGSLSNFAGGFIILIVRPFKVGNYIETSGYNGTVEEIGLFYTTLSTPDNKEILIPNGVLSNGSLINYNRRSTRRVDIVFQVGYESNISQVKRILREIIDTDNRILQYPTPFIALNEYGASSINFVVRVWTKTENYWMVYFNLLEKVKLKFDEENIIIPYPQMDINLKKEDN